MGSDRLEREGECVSCGECCKTLRLVTPYKRLLEEHGAISEAEIYYSFRGGKITGVDKKRNLVSVEFDIPCDKLTADNHCMLHDDPAKKPVVCHRYPKGPDDIPTCGYTFNIPRGY